MSIRKRIEKLEEHQAEAEPEKRPLTWKELITMARNYENIPGWEEFIRERTEDNDHENEPDKTA